MTLVVQCVSLREKEEQQRKDTIVERIERESWTLTTKVNWKQPEVSNLKAQRARVFILNYRKLIFLEAKVTADP